MLSGIFVVVKQRVSTPPPKKTPQKQTSVNQRVGKRHRALRPCWLDDPGALEGKQDETHTKKCLMEMNPRLRAGRGARRHASGNDLHTGVVVTYMLLSLLTTVKKFDKLTLITLR